MALKFTTTSDLAELNGIKALIYGESGCGKTVLTATAPDPFFISAEAGALSLKPSNLAKIYGDGNDKIATNIPAVEVASIADLKEAYDWVLNSDDAKGFQTICIDSISEIAEIVLADEQKRHSDKRMPYQMLITEMIPLIKAFRDLKGKNVYFTAKQDRYRDDVTGVTTYGPSFPGQRLGISIPYLFDEMFRLVKGEEYRYLQTESDVQYTAKDRSGSLDAQEKPDLTYVFNKIMQSP